MKTAYNRLLRLAFAIFMVAGFVIQVTAQTITFTKPTDWQHVAALNNMAGTVEAGPADIAQVVFSIFDTSLQRYWNGAAYQVAPTNLAATFVGTNWAPAAGVVFPIPVYGRTYQLAATATDIENNTATTTISVYTDGVDFSPLCDGQTVSSLSALGGAISSGITGISSLVFRIHEVDIEGGSGRYWNGTNFQSTAVWLATTRTTNRWSPAVPMPALNSGQSYELTVTMTDAQGTQSSTITVDATMTVLTWDPGTAPGGTELVFAPNGNGGNYWFQITPQTPNAGVWRTALNVPSGQASVYMSHNWTPTTYSYEYASANPGSNGFVLNTSQFQPGQSWYILVHAPTCTNWSLMSGDIFVYDLGSLAADLSSSTNGSIRAEGMIFFKTMIPSDTAAWQLWLNGATNQLYVQKVAAPITNWGAYELTQAKQMLVVPPYLAVETFNGVYFVGVPGRPGSAINLTSRKQPIIQVPFSSSTNITIGSNVCPYVTYQVQVPVQQIAWQLNLAPSSGNPAISVRRDKVPNEFRNDAFSEVPQGVGASVSLVPSPPNSNDPGLSDGTFYVTVYSTNSYTCSFTSGNPVITDVPYIFCVTNNVPNRAGWRYYRVIEEQLGTLGWELLLSNQVPGTEIALRRNAVPGRWEYRNNDPDNYDDYASYKLGYVDYSKTIGMLQRVGHQSDIWYIGVYTPTQALGSFVLRGRELIPQTVSFDGTGSSAVVTNQLPGIWGFFRIDVPTNSLGWDIRLTNVTGNPQMVVRRALLPTSFGSSGNPRSYDNWIDEDMQFVGNTSWPECSGAPMLTLAMGMPLQAGTYYVGVMDENGNCGYTLLSRGIGETNFSIRIPTLAFDGSATNVTAQPVREWKFFRINVPADSNLLGWDVRLTNVIAGTPGMVISRDIIPTSLETTWAGDWYDCTPYVCTYPWNRTNWPSGRQWLGTADWSQCDGRPPMLAMAKGYPLQPGTYYVGIFDSCNVSSCTLMNRGIGLTNYTIPVRNLNFAGGQATNLALPVGEADYYRVVVPANQPDWKLHLNANLGDLLLKVQRDYLPGIGNDGYGCVQPGKGGQIMNKLGNEQWALMPENQDSSVSNGVYYVLVGSQGTNVVDGCGGTGKAKYTIDSGTNLVVLPNNLSYSTDLVHATNQQGGELNFYQFNVPAGLATVEVRLENKVGSPKMYLKKDSYRVTPEDHYGNYGGVTPQWSDANFILLVNPEPGTYSLSVYAEGDAYYGTYPNASYTLRVKAVAPTSVTFDGGTSTVGSQFANMWRFFQITVPADALAWDLRLTNVTGNPQMVVRRGSLPTGFETTYYWSPRDNTTWPIDYQWQANNYWSGCSTPPMLMMTMGKPLQAGTYYVGVMDQSENCSYTLLSRGVGETNYSIRVKPVAFDGFATNLIAQAQGEWKFFRITVPADTNLLGWDVRLTNVTAGNPGMVVSRGLLPSAVETTVAGDWLWCPWYCTYPWQRTNWPSSYEWMGGADWSQCNDRPPMLAMAKGYPLQPGTYYVGIFDPCNVSSFTFVSRGIGLTNYAIRVRDLNINGLVSTNLAVGEGDYYRVVVPSGLPNWKLNLGANLGNVMMKVHKGYLPSIGNGDYGALLPDQGGQTMNKGGDEQWVLLPENDNTSVSNGTYYVLVASQGQNDWYGCGGDQYASYTLSSGTELIPLPDTLPTTDIVYPDAAFDGESKFYQFNVPAGLTSLEVHLDNRNNDPLMFLTNGPSLIGPGLANYRYGNFGGGRFSWSDANLITIANPQPGTYTLVIYANGNGSGYNDASYDIRIHAGAQSVVAFDGGTARVDYQEPRTWRYFRVDVPADALGWDLRLVDVTGNPEMVVRRELLPSGLGSTWPGPTGPRGYTNWPTDYQWQADKYWSECSGAPMLMMAMGRPLQAGTYFVGVTDEYGECSYTLQSRGVGENNYSIRVQPAAFDGSTSYITAQPQGEWKFFRINVPADTNLLGWDIRLNNVSYGNPGMVVSRDAIPSAVETTMAPDWLWCPYYCYYPWQRTNWGSGYEWMGGSDWSQCYDRPPMLAMAKGYPLQPGTYYVGVFDPCNESSCTLVSRGIGSTNYTIPVRDLNFAGGQAANSALPVADGDYYRVVVPPNQPDWKLHVNATVGDVFLKVMRDYVPSINYGSYGALQPEQGGATIMKPGDEQWALMPENGNTDVTPGTYYVLVVSQGQNVMYNCGGTATSSYTIDSGSELIVLPNELSYTKDLLYTNSQGGGEAKFYQFNVPSGSQCLEVRLENRVGNPVMYLNTGTNIIGGFPYGCYGGTGSQWSDGFLITIPNVTPGTYSLSVYGSTDDSGSYADASYVLRVRTPVIPALSFSPELNSPSLTNAVANVLLAHNQHQFYQVTVPASVNGAPVLGWRLNLTALNGSPKLRVRPSFLPGSGGCDTTDYAVGDIVIAPPYLTPGTWFVDVLGEGLTTFSLNSRVITTNTLARPLWAMPQFGQTTTAPGLTLPMFGDSGVDTNGNPILDPETGTVTDQGVNLEQGQFNFYAIMVPTNNAGLLRTELQAISGNPNLYLRVGAAPTMRHCIWGGCSWECGSPRLPVDRELTGSTTEYGNWVPMDGRFETNLTPGLWVLAVQAGDNANARYRLKLSCGNPVTNALVQNLALNGGSFTNQSIAGGDWRYYRVQIPDPAPANWDLTFLCSLGDARMFVRDTVPPGQGETIYDNRDWSSDYKNQGPYPSSITQGTHTFSTPPLRPGSVYYLGFWSDRDATFSISSSTSGGTVPVNGSIDFRGGGTNTVIPAYSSAFYRIDVPQTATKMCFVATNSGNVELLLDQGTMALPGSYAPWMSWGASPAFCDYDLTDDYNYWPWLPGFTYYLTATNASSSPQDLGVSFAPWITSQPQSQTVNEGATVTFSVSALSSAPLTYQWRYNGGNISGATGSSFVMPNVTTNDAGTYSVIVANVAGQVSSASATLTVIACAQPAITTQPLSQSVAAGANVSFSVVATGAAPLRYQWKFNGNNIAGATTSIYSLSSVQTGNVGSYQVSVTNACGTLLSSVATLTLTTTNNQPTLTLGTSTNIEAMVNFESMSDFRSDSVMFRWPYNSGSTVNFLDLSQYQDSVLSTNFPAGNPNGSGSKVLKVDWTFLTGTSYPWLRLVTANSLYIPNPAVNFTGGRIRFDIYVTRPIKLGLGLRETGCNVPVASNGGTVGSIEWIGVTSKVYGSPTCTRTINSNVWTTVEFNLQSDPRVGFTGNGYLDGAQGVLDHLAIVPNGGLTNYTVYLDNFQMITAKTLPTAITMNTGSTLSFKAVGTDRDPGQTLTYSLVNPPTGASIDPSTGVFSWTPNSSTTATINVQVTDNGGPPRSSNVSFTATVNTDPLGVMSDGASALASAGEKVTLSWPATVGTAYQVQCKQGNGEWTNVGEPIVASSPEAAVEVAGGDQETTYRIIDLGGPVADQ